MAESLGEKLKQARDERGISLSEVAEQTRISPLYLEAIENDDYRTLPGGIFNKGFVKSFAKYVGVDEHEALQDYTRIISSQEKTKSEDDKNNYRPEVLTDDSSGPSMLPTIIFAVIILGLMTWGVLALVNYLQTSQSSVAEANIADNNVKTPPTTANANVNTNGAVADGEIPATDEIKVKIGVSTGELSVATEADGKKDTILLSDATIKEKEYTAEESLKISYYKGIAANAEITVNGKKIETPMPPPGWRKNALNYEINMNNIKQILKSGKISFGGEPATNANTNANNGANTKAPAQ